MTCLELDRDAPRRRPEGVRPAGYQRWTNLLFAHYRLAAETVRALVPSELELDLWDGDAFVGIVPFEMHDIRLAWQPRIFGLDFLETNLRTYVHHRGEPGVFFFSLEASSRLAVEAARAGWGLPYHLASMSTARDGDWIDYASTRRATRHSRASAGAHFRARYRAGAALETSQPGSLEFFLLERYYLFANQRGRTMKGHVHHVPYPAFSAEAGAFETTLLEAAGLPAPRGRPATLHFSPGVDVEVFGPWAVS
ncbi:MAG TPA: DUF2071 domain-containing protein [Polyangiaceae bacterium]|jgi:uncharacterized protein YqjF (DUF2071 family)|nr:DUF2071 domain-containing protein [Polyangiaceae bacterium]